MVEGDAVAAAERRLLAPRGELLIALDQGQSGAAPDLPAGDEEAAWGRSWQLDVAASEAGLLVAEAAPFAPFYDTCGHRGIGRARAFEPRDVRDRVLIPRRPSRESSTSAKES